MLVITRTEGSKFYLILGEERVEIEVLDIRAEHGKKARIGITAPEWVHIERDDMKCKEPKPSQQNLKKPEGD
jgi:sRNA-binding carbon storage regulator CsrA